jgi:glucokinase
MNLIAADIGGTYSRFAWTDGGPARELPTQVLKNADFESLEAAIAQALQGLGVADRAIDLMVLALPGPVHDDPVTLTNIDWRADRLTLQRRFDIARLQIVNDFQAAALGAVQQPYERLEVLNPATPDAGPRVVAGAGTGLGMAWLCDDRLDRLPQATEGGHLDFAPGSDTEVALYRRLAARYGHVSYERILSGDGLVDTYRHFAGDSAAAATPEAIVAQAREHHAAARQAIETFVAIFAAYAGNLALVFNPGGGIYLCGGLTAHLAEWFDAGLFQARYAAKGRMSAVVQRVPVFLVSRHDTGLTGAVSIARQLYRAEQ